jgi:hypothetical protein
MPGLRSTLNGRTHSTRVGPQRKQAEDDRDVSVSIYSLELDLEPDGPDVQPRT